MDTTNHMETRRMESLTANEEVITEEHEQLARYAKALGHPVRIYILKTLANQACCYSGDLAELLPIARSTLSQHLSELKSAGLIQGEFNPPKIKYCINKENWERSKRLMLELYGVEPAA